MAFLDNSGDIILDAVLTDTGRKRMAEGNFRITKFALGDEEIDYSLYNYNDTRGSAYFDIDILSTPILEACTDNAAGLKSKLLSIPRTDFTFLPVIKLSQVDPNTKMYNANSIEGTFVIPVDVTTSQKSAFRSDQNGVLWTQYAKYICLHQGIDNTEVPHTNALADYSPDLVETQYIVEFDTRLGNISNIGTPRTNAVVSYIDDDRIGSWFFTLNQANGFVEQLNLTATNDDSQSPIAGSRGTKLDFSITPTTDLAANDFLFLKLGAEITIGSDDYYYIDTHARVMGATTGYRIDIPVRFLKLK